jgi:hypothetical protein
MLYAALQASILVGAFVARFPMSRGRVFGQREEG